MSARALSFSMRVLSTQGLWLLAAAALVVFSAGLLTPAGAAPLPVREPITVSDDVVRIGDVFTLPAAHAHMANRPLARAPAPGRSVSVTPAWLADTVARHGLRWTPPASLKRVTVTRIGVVVPAERLEAVLAAHLAAQTPLRSWSVRLTDPRDRHLPPDAEPNPRIEEVNYTARTGRLVAQMRLTPDSAPIRVTGVAEPAIAVVRLSRDIPRDGFISREDLQVRWEPENRAPRDGLKSAEEAVGWRARRALQADAPLRRSDLTLPNAVSRGQAAMVTFQRGRLTLTMRVRALENAPAGAVARFQNGQSNQIFEALVTGPGKAVVASTGALMASRTDVTPS